MSSDAINQSRIQPLIDYFKKEKVFGNRYTAIAFPLIAILAFTLVSVSLKTYHITHGQILFNCALPVVILTLGCSVLKVIFKEKIKKDLDFERPEILHRIRTFAKHLMKSKEFIISSIALVAASALFLGLGIGNGTNHMSAFSQYLDNAASTAFKVTTIVTLSFAVCLYWIGMHLKKFWKEHSQVLMNQFDCLKRPNVEPQNDREMLYTTDM